jgi:hypothetical protein
MRQRRHPKIKVWVWGYRGSTVGGCAVKWWGTALTVGAWDAAGGAGGPEERRWRKGGGRDGGREEEA